MTINAEPWFYFVDYQDDLEQVLHELQQREFEAGRYYPATDTLEFPVGLDEKPGCKHESIAEATKAASPGGTRSILDVEKIGNRDERGTAFALSSDELRFLYGTDRPTREMIEDETDWDALLALGDFGQAEAAYMILFEGDNPVEILFVGIASS